MPAATAVRTRSPTSAPATTFRATPASTPTATAARTGRCWPWPTSAGGAASASPDCPGSIAGRGHRLETHGHEAPVLEHVVVAAVPARGVEPAVEHQQAAVGAIVEHLALAFQAAGHRWQHDQPAAAAVGGQQAQAVAAAAPLHQHLVAGEV